MSTPVLPSRDDILAIEIKINKYHILSNRPTINHGWFEHAGLLAFSECKKCPGLPGGLAGFSANMNRGKCSSLCHPAPPWAQC